MFLNIWYRAVISAVNESRRGDMMFDEFGWIGWFGVKGFLLMNVECIWMSFGIFGEVECRHGLMAITP
jgi:hypothetical protein